MKNIECDLQVFNLLPAGIIFIMFQGLMYKVEESVFKSFIQCRIRSTVYTIYTYTYTHTYSKLYGYIH